MARRTRLARSESWRWVMLGMSCPLQPLCDLDQALRVDLEAVGRNTAGLRHGCKGLVDAQPVEEVADSGLVDTALVVVQVDVLGHSPGQVNREGAGLGVQPLTGAAVDEGVDEVGDEQPAGSSGPRRGGWVEPGLMLTMRAGE